MQEAFSPWAVAVNLSCCPDPLPCSHSLRSCGSAACWWRSGDPLQGPRGAERSHVWKWRPITHLHTVCVWGSVCHRRQPTMAMLKTETENNNSTALVSQGPFVCYFSAVFFHVGDDEGQTLPLPVLLRGDIYRQGEPRSYLWRVPENQSSHWQL